MDSQTTASSIEELIDSQSSTWSDIATTTSRVNNALSILGKGSISPLKSQLTTNIEDASNRTIRHYKRKAKQGVDALMESIAPGQGHKLWKILLTECSEGYKPTCTSNSNEMDNDLTLLIIKLYNESEKNQEKLQLLSMIANLSKVRS